MTEITQEQLKTLLSQKDRTQGLKLLPSYLNGLVLNQYAADEQLLYALTAAYLSLEGNVSLEDFSNWVNKYYGGPLAGCDSVSRTERICQATINAAYLARTPDPEASIALSVVRVSTNIERALS